MGQPQVENKKYTIEEWLELERAEGIRYEYHFGEIFEMAGGTINHTTIGGNAHRFMEAHFDDNESGCRAFNSDMKIQVTKAGRYVYADTVAVYGNIEESQSIIGAITNPVLVVEVTSKDSETYDRNGKYELYSLLSTIRQYIIVSQISPFVTIYNRNDETGRFDETPREIRGL